MGCAASSDDRAERRRRGRALEQGEASTTGLLGQDQEPLARKRRGCKVAPEPNEQEDPAASEPAMPGSPSFRYYCQKAAAVDALVAEAEARDGEGSVRITETSQEPTTSELPVSVEDTTKNKIVEVSKPKQVTKWLRFRGLAIVAAAWYNLFSRRSSDASFCGGSKVSFSQPRSRPCCSCKFSYLTRHRCMGSFTCFLTSWLTKAWLIQSSFMVLALHHLLFFNLGYCL